MPTPDLPDPAHPTADSMLTRKFGREVANYFSGSPLNRVGFLRHDHTFLSESLRHPTTSFLLLNDLQPLISDKTKLAFVKHEEVSDIISGDPYAAAEDEIIATYNSSKHVPQLIFLGLDERVKGALTHKDGHSGAPFFALDVTPRASVADACKKLTSDLESRGLTFAKGRAMDLNAHDAAIFAEARQMTDWNLRNPFCAQCGHPTLSVNGGFKRICPPNDLVNLPSTATATTADKPDPDSARPPCATRKGISNLSFPRTDPTVIMAVVNAKGTHILLGRGKRFPPHFYSTLAGFCEPAESVEEAVRREVWEEAGIHLGRVVIHSTQPWPYPANLMIGAIGQSVAHGEKIDLGNDPELADAKWFSVEEIREVLKGSTAGLEEVPEGYVEGSLRLPPPTAIAHQLMSAVCNGFLGAHPKV